MTDSATLAATLAATLTVTHCNTEREESSAVFVDNGSCATTDTATQ